MAEPRKVFRIEQTAGALRSALTAPVAQSADAARSSRAETARLGEAAEQLCRIAHELDAVVTGTNEATQKILTAAEEIDQAANNLSAALKGKIEQGPAQDIRDHVIRIFEACNFHDLIGQRVGKVKATLTAIEDRVARVLGEIKTAPPASTRAEAAQYLHGPRLDIDRGHVTQAEIDAVFRG